MTKPATRPLAAPLLLALFALWLAPVAAAQQLRVTQTDDLNFGSMTPGQDQTRTTTACIYRGEGGDSYTLTVNDSTPGANFGLYNPLGYTLPFTLEWRGTSGNFVQLNKNFSQTFSGANTVDEHCQGTYNATMRLTILGQDMWGMPSGTFSTTISVMIEP